MADTIRVLVPGDEDALRAFLEPRVASSMFLLGNMLAVGLDDRGKWLEGTYAAAFEGGVIVGVAAHFWNRYLVMQAPDAIAVCRAALSASGREIGGLLGPARQVEQVRSAFAIDPAGYQIDEVEYLYTLHLVDLVVPPTLVDNGVWARLARPSDRDVLVEWRIGYSVELLNEPDDALQRDRSLAEVNRKIDQGKTWVLEDQTGQLLAQSGFNASLPGAMQVGGVYTPPHLRGRGYARAVVAGSLLAVRDQGVHLGVLYTGVENHAAQRAYTSIGFRHTGDYRVILLRTPLMPVPAASWGGTTDTITSLSK